MIKEESAYAYCVEDIRFIENYEKAVADQTQTWHLHHKVEILPCGSFTPADLKRFGLYYHRPASELVFLPRAQHTALHNANRYVSDETRERLRAAFSGERNPNFGKIRSEETRRRISEAHKGKRVSDEQKAHLSRKLKGIRWWNNGEVTVGAVECPPGFVRGRLIKKPRA